MTLSNPRRSRRKELIRESDRTLYDVTERRRISFAELRDYMGDGGSFEARRHDSGADCTAHVLQELLTDSLASSFVPGFKGGGMPGPFDLFLRMTELRSGGYDSRRDWADWDDGGRRRDWRDDSRLPPGRDTPRSTTGPRPPSDWGEDDLDGAAGDRG